MSGQDEEGVSQARVRLKVRRGWVTDEPGSCVTLAVGLFHAPLVAQQLVCDHSLVFKQSSKLCSLEKSCWAIITPVLTLQPAQVWLLLSSGGAKREGFRQSPLGSQKDCLK